jgi:hypothetical protein
METGDGRKGDQRRIGKEAGAWLRYRLLTEQ